ncbi:hypothetical protein M3P05_13130 [Sansalvadorimonas sp. 2012CJ34-2]|uniref:Uncharacterized protein n=1 Tax=Parendozoicomonas callyspongiae TaxID=2942213 RepID=A0ABT0PHL3_9GAMM|nr:hypothetical protein [Sansalvadorimonas sp. 2012CJ34-2]MCL6270867.1 hypothetical protein [Sansalvadorimonas sp. 2012CJ34-2]
MYIKDFNNKILCLCIFLFCQQTFGLSTLFLPGIYINQVKSTLVTEPCIEVVTGVDNTGELTPQQWLLTLAERSENNFPLKSFPPNARPRDFSKGALARIAVIISHQYKGEEQIFLSLFLPKKTKNEEPLFELLASTVQNSESPKKITPFYQRVNVAVTKSFADLLIRKATSAPEKGKPGAETALFDLREEDDEAAVAIAILDQTPCLPTSGQLISAETYPVFVVRAKLESEDSDYISVENPLELEAVREGAEILLSTSSPFLSSGIESMGATPSSTYSPSSHCQMISMRSRKYGEIPSPGAAKKQPPSRYRTAHTPLPVMAAEKEPDIQFELSLDDKFIERLTEVELVSESHYENSPVVSSDNEASEDMMFGHFSPISSYTHGSSPSPSASGGGFPAASPYDNSLRKKIGNNKPSLRTFRFVSDDKYVNSFQAIPLAPSSSRNNADDQDDDEYVEMGSHSEFRKDDWGVPSAVQPLTHPVRRQPAGESLHIPDVFLQGAGIVSFPECTDQSGKCFPQYFSCILEQYFLKKIKNVNPIMSEHDQELIEWLKKTVRVAKEDLDSVIDWEHPFMLNFSERHMEFLSLFKGFDEYRDALFEIFDVVFSHSEEVVINIKKLKEWQFFSNGMTSESNGWMENVSQEGLRVIAAAKNDDPVILLCPHIPPLKEVLSQESHIDNVHKFKRFESRVSQFNEFSKKGEVLYLSYMEIETKHEGVTKTQHEQTKDSYNKMLACLSDLMPFMIISDCVRSVAGFNEMLSSLKVVRNIVSSKDGQSYYKYDAVRKVQFILFIRLLLHRFDDTVDKSLVKGLVRKFLNHIDKDVWFHVHEMPQVKMIDIKSQLAWLNALNLFKFQRDYQMYSSNEKLQINVVRRVGNVARGLLGSVRKIYPYGIPREVISVDKLGILSNTAELYDQQQLPSHTSDPSKYKSPKSFMKSRKSDDEVVRELDSVVSLSREVFFVRVYDHFTSK